MTDREPLSSNERAVRLVFDRARLQADDAPRLMLGVAVSSGVDSIESALVAISGGGLDARVQLLATQTAEIAPDVTERFGRLQSEPQKPGASAVLAASLQEQQAELIDRTLRQVGVEPQDVLAVGVHDPGLWDLADYTATAYVSLCDAARLAKATSINVIDAFPARDLAQGGQGGPITSLAQWVLLNHPSRRRALIDLGRSVTLTFLPGGRDRADRVLSFQVGPGSGLLDLLACQLTSGAQRYDPGGRLAVQGQQIPELLDHWLADPYFKRPLPRWHPWGVRPERFFTESVQMAIQAGWSVRDLLCTATHFIAAAIEKAVERLPQASTIEEFVICGGGQQNGLLLRELASRLGNGRIVHLNDLGMADEALRPAAAAVLAMMHVDQTPANPSAVTGANAPSVLGRLTPGSPQNWRRLIQQAAQAPPPKTPIRAVV